MHPMRSRVLACTQACMDACTHACTPKYIRDIRSLRQVRSLQTATHLARPLLVAPHSQPARAPPQSTHRTSVQITANSRPPGAPAAHSDPQPGSKGTGPRRSLRRRGRPPAEQGLTARWHCVGGNRWGMFVRQQGHATCMHGGMHALSACMQTHMHATHASCSARTHTHTHACTHNALDASGIHPLLPHQLLHTPHAPHPDHHPLYTFKCTTHQPMSTMLLMPAGSTPRSRISFCMHAL